MFIVFIVLLTYLNIGFQRGFDSNLLVDRSNLKDYYTGLNLRLTHSPMDKPWGYEFAASSNFLDNYSDMNFLGFRGSISYFKDFGKVGNYIESGVDFSWDLLSPYQSFSIIPGIASRIYLDQRRKTSLIPGWDLSFMVSDEGYIVENTPRIRLNTVFWDISLLLMTTLKWRYSVIYLQRSPVGVGGNPLVPHYGIEEENLFAGDFSFRIGRKFGELLGLFYGLNCHFLPTGGYVNVEGLKEKLDPFNKEEYAYTGISHAFELNLEMKEISINYSYAFGYRDYRIVDSTQSSIFRSDLAYYHSLKGTVPLIRKELRLGLSFFLNYESNNSNLSEFSYTRKEFGGGLYLEL